MPGYKELDQDPRCLYGWGPPVCNCMFGHACFRPFGHPGKCWDAGVKPSSTPNPLPCWQRQRPKDWDTRGRAEADHPVNYPKADLAPPEDNSAHL